MKINSIIAGVLLAMSFISYNTVFAQAIDWEAVPKLHSVPDSFAKEAAVFVLDKRKIQVANEDQSIYTYRTSHQLIKIETDKGIEYFNTMTVGVEQGNELVAMNARTIKANGQVVNIASEQIKTSLTEQGGTQYHVAFEGVEIGAEVELIYTERRPFSAFGLELMQFGLPVMKASFHLETPNFMEFEAKGYNGFPSAGEVQLADTRYYSAESKNIPALDEEEYSDFAKNLKRIEYKLNHIGGKTQRMYSWDKLAEKMQKEYAIFSNKEIKAVQKFLTAGGVNMDDRELDKVRKIEALLKSSLVLQENLRDEKYTELAHIIDKKTTNETGIVRMFMAAFAATGVEATIGLTSNRYEYSIDPEFENWNRLDVYLIYLPGLREYLAPSFITYRSPMIPAAARGNKGIFTNSNAATAIVQDIPSLAYMLSNNGVEATISFDEEMNVTVDAVHSFTGYGASSLREAFVFIEKEKEPELVQSLVSIAENKEAINSYAIENAELESYATAKPLLVKSTINAPQLLESAGAKLLLKVGDVLGPQAQLYSDEKRVLPISMPFAHMLDRKIVVNIPDGYKVANAAAAKMNVKDKAETMGFVSDYTLDGNKMTINIHEYYSKSDYPASEIEAFRSVINAAADFNKVTLVLERK